MRKIARKITILGLGLIGLPYFSYATLPVIDYTEVAKTVQEVKLIQNSYQELQQQYNQLQAQYNAMTGQYGWGNWHNTVQDIQQNLEWVPNDWNSALQKLSGGNPERYQELLTQYQTDHPVLSQTNYQNGATPESAQNYQNQVATNQVSSATVTGEFNDIQRHLDQLQQLGAEIENSQQNNTIKSAIDLNSRIELEVAYISMEELRMQAVLNQQTAALSNNQITQETESSEFNHAEEDPNS